MKKIFLFTFFIIILNPLLFSQIDSTTLWYKAIFDTTADFYTIRDIQEQYFLDHPDSIEDESGTRSMFHRWIQFWNNRVANDGVGIASITKALRNYNEVYQNIDQIYEPPENPVSDWLFLGPKGINTQSYGIVTCTKFDESDPTLKTIYAGTGASGLWKTTDGGLTWRNITPQFYAEGLGVRDILIHPTNPDIIYLATCIGYAGAPSYYFGKGILKTINGGKSWENSLPFDASEKKPITRFLMDPTNSDNILAFGENYIYHRNSRNYLTVFLS